LSEPVSDRVYVAQVLSLFSSVAASVVMAGIFMTAVAVAYEQTGALSFLTVGVVGCILNIWRIAACVLLRKLAKVPTLGRAEAARFEALFAVPYVSFAVLMGLFGYLAFRNSNTELHMLMICVAVGYCAGVASNCGLRPPLALSSILLAIWPIIYVSLLKHDHIYTALAVVAAALIVGAARSIMVRFEESRTEIAARISSVGLARRDILTSLPNRLALNEFFIGRAALSGPDTSIAVHYLDLDGFKPVNDKHGHAVGDQLLIAVADRLREVIRKTDMVARLGGDEFAIVQFGLRDDDEAHALSWRVREMFQRPFSLGASVFSITSSIGTIVTADRASALDDLLQLADEKLYCVKRARRKLHLKAVV